MRKPGVLFRADGSSELGMGHVRRCMALAQSCQRDDLDVYLAHIDLATEAIENLKQANITPVALNPTPHCTVSDAQALVEFATHHDIRWLIIDHPTLSDEYEHSVREGYKDMIVVIDGQNRQHHCDVLVNPNAFATTENCRLSVPESCLILAGYKYFMIDDCYLLQNSDSTTPAKTPIGNRILVTLGAADPQNTTLKICQALCELAGEVGTDHNAIPTVVDVVLGQSNRHAKSVVDFTSRQSLSRHADPRFNVIHAPANLVELLERSTLCISAGGITLGEAAYMGTPIVGIPILDNQNATIEALSNMGVCIAASTDTVARVCKYLLASESARLQLSKTASTLVDGRGKQRIAACTWGANDDHINE